MYIVYNYDRTTKESKHDRVALAGSHQFRAVTYTMKNTLYRLYIYCYLWALKTDSCDGSSFWCLRIEKLKTNGTCRGERASLLTSLHEPTLGVHVVHVNT